MGQCGGGGIGGGGGWPMTEGRGLGKLQEELEEEETVAHQPPLPQNVARNWSDEDLFCRSVIGSDLDGIFYFYTTFVVARASRKWTAVYD